MKEDLDSCQSNRENENINHVNQKWFSHWSYHICLEGDGSGLFQGRSGNRAAGRASELPIGCTLAFFSKGRALIFFRWDTSWPDDDLHAQCCHWAGLSACVPLIQINCCSFLNALAQFPDLVPTFGEMQGASGFLVTVLALYSTSNALVCLCWIFWGQASGMSGLLYWSVWAWELWPSRRDLLGWLEPSPSWADTAAAGCRTSSRSRCTCRGWAQGTGKPDFCQLDKVCRDQKRCIVSLGSCSRCVGKQSWKEGQFCKDTVSGKGGRICFQIGRFVFHIWRVTLFFFRILCSN